MLKNIFYIFIFLGFVFFWGWVFLTTTTLVLIFKKEVDHSVEPALVWNLLNC